MKRSYSFTILLTSLLFIMVALSALNTQTPLWLVQDRFDDWQIGLVGSSYFIGNLVGTLIASWIIAKVEVKKAYCSVCILIAIATFAMNLNINLYSWSFWRFLMGVACAVIWIIIESCILISSTTKNRSKLVAIYMMTYYLGMVIGQALLQFFSQSILYFALVISILMVLAIIFILLTNYHLPQEKNGSANIMPMIVYRPARLGLIGCIIAGVVLGGAYALLPAYYDLLGFSKDQVANWMMLIIASGLIAQMPIGHLSNRIGPRITLSITMTIFSFACVIMFFNFYPIIAIILFGMASYTLYPLAMTWACSSVGKNQIVLMNQTMNLAYTVGCLVSPIIMSAVMTKFGNNYLFICFIVVAVYFIGLLAYRRHK